MAVDTLNVDAGSDRRQALLQRLFGMNQANMAADNSMDTLNRRNARQYNLPYQPNPGRFIAPTPSAGPVQQAIFPGLPVTGTSPYVTQPPVQKLLISQTSPTQFTRPPSTLALPGTIDQTTLALLRTRQANGSGVSS